jgi:hypothetical protein
VTASGRLLVIARRWFADVDAEWSNHGVIVGD